MNASPSRPILVVGVTHRSGTNHLWSLLALHPDVRTAEPILEDHIPDGAGRVFDGLRQIVAGWESEWVDPAWAGREAPAAVGRALLSFLDPQPDAPGRLLSKTPGAHRLDALFGLVPDADVLLLIRDGRDVTASGMRGFGWSFEEGRRRWQRGANEIMRAVGRPLPVGMRVRVVRHEDLVSHPERTIMDLLDWLNLDPDRYEIDRARDVPVLGSSFAGDSSVTWDPLERPEGFDTRGRSAGWTGVQQARFALRAGVELQAFDYEIPTLSPRDRFLGLLGEAAFMAKARLRRLVRG